MRCIIESDNIKALRPRFVACTYEALPGRTGLKLFKWLSVQQIVGRRLVGNFAGVARVGGVERVERVGGAQPCTGAV